MTHTEPFTNDEVSLGRAPDLVMVLNTPKGRGIVARRDIAARSVVDVSPVLVMPLEDVDAIKSTALFHYTYNWPVIIRREGGGSGGTSAQTQAVALGLGSLFNHSALDQNVGWERDVVAQCITYTALRDIRAGEELCINYGRLWFVDADAEPMDEDEADIIEALGRIESW